MQSSWISPLLMNGAYERAATNTLTLCPVKNIIKHSIIDITHKKYKLETQARVKLRCIKSH